MSISNMKEYKKVIKDNGEIKFYGSNKDIKIFYAKPKWGKEQLPCFRYRGNIYYLAEFMRVNKSCPDYLHEFNGYYNDSAFSGVVIKLSRDGEGVKAFTFVS